MSRALRALRALMSILGLMVATTQVYGCNGMEMATSTNSVGPVAFYGLVVGTSGVDPLEPIPDPPYDPLTLGVVAQELVATDLPELAREV